MWPGLRCIDGSGKVAPEIFGEPEVRKKGIEVSERKLAQRELKEKLAVACRVLAAEGHSDIIFGHMSARAPSGDRFWMKGAGVGLEEITPRDLVLVDLDGNKIEGTRPRHAEYPIHSEIYRRRPEVMAVVHTHPLFSTVLGSTEHELRPVTHEGSFFVPPLVPKFDLTTDLIATRELGAAVAEAMGEHKALFLKNHGVVLAAESIEQACVAAVLLEKAARAQLLAISAGRFSWTDDKEALLKREHIYHARSIEQVFEYFVRKLKGNLKSA